MQIVLESDFINLMLNGVYYIHAIGKDSGIKIASFKRNQNKKTVSMDELNLFDNI